MTFKDLGLIDPILQALDTKGYTNPTPIQEQAIPILLKKKDLLGCAQTGTGKTAAFSIPIIQHLENQKDHEKGGRKIRSLIVTPTRELAIQIDDNLSLYSKHTRIKNVVIFGGVKQGQQVAQLKQGADILVATPGRLLDLINQKIISLRDVEYFVLDEADQMLDMGFIHDIKKIIALLPEKRQSLFFSATMPPSIVDLSKKILGAYESVTIKPQQATAERVEQALYYVSKRNKIKLLIDILNERSTDSTLVFSRTKYGADKIVRKLQKAGIKGAAIHGNKAQNNRQKALNAFKEGKIRVLVATDIAARGIDVAELALVVNYDLPNVPETYVHRIGRTGRASASGIALSFCMEDEKPNLKSIQKLIKQTIPVISDHAYEGLVDEPLEHNPQQKNGQKNRGQGNQNQPSKKPKKPKKKRPNHQNSRNTEKGSEGRNHKSTEKPKQNTKEKDQNRDQRKTDDRPFAHTKNKKKRNKKKRSNNPKVDPITGKKRPDRGYLKLLE